MPGNTLPQTGPTVGKKLFFLFAAMAVLILSLVALYVSSYRQSNRQLDALLHVYNKKLDIGSQVELATTEMQGAQRGLMLSYAMKDPGAATQYLKLYEDSSRRITAALSEFRPLLASNVEDVAFNSILANLSAWKPRFKQLEILCEAGDIDGAYKLRNQNKLISAQMHGSATSLVNEQRRFMKAMEAQQGASTERYNGIALLVVLFSLALGAVAALAVRKIQHQLRHSIEAIHKGADLVALEAGQISSSSRDLAQGASIQAASLQQTAASSAEMASITRKNAESSQNAAEFMHAVNRSVITANSTLANMMTRMAEIGASSGKISNIIKIIDGIAFQTTILSLNAAVEAARAGKAGLGFAVVADEVGKLALRTTEAANDTSTLIAESIQKSAEGSKQLAEVADSIRAITDSADKVKTLVDMVDASSKEQAKGIEQIFSSVAQMDQLTQQTASNAEQSAAASQELSSQSQALIAVVGQLRALLGAGSTSHSADTASELPPAPPRSAYQQSH